MSISVREPELPQAFLTLERAPIAAPADPNSREGEFQLRRAELIGEIRSLGFNPRRWVRPINEFGAAQAAHLTLACRCVLESTGWLVQRGRVDLTLEHEVTRERWIAPFSDIERVEARRRLDSPGSH